MGKFINDFAHNKSKSSNAKESLITQNGMKYRLPIISSNISSVPAISKKIHIIAKYIKEKKLKEKNGNTTVTNQLEEIPSKKQEISDEKILSDIEVIQNQCHTIQKEMTALSIIRTRLFWLLKKTTSHETFRNHAFT